MVLSKKEMGQLIKKARGHKSEIIGIKYTQSMLADDLDISRGYIGDIENGRIYPNYVLLNKIAEKCEVPFSFFGEDNAEDRDYMNEIDEDTKTAKSTQHPYDSPGITDVKEAMNLILSQPGLMLNGEMLSDESKIALANALQYGLAFAELMQKKEKGEK